MRAKNGFVAGVGINDYDGSIKVDGKLIKSYSIWKSMLERCYTRKASKTYYNIVTVCDEWHRFSNFKKWFDVNHFAGWHMDKDILVIGNKVYSPDTCIFVPSWLNYFVIEMTTNKGQYPCGVGKLSGSSGQTPYISQCNNPITKKRDYLGVFDTPELAHEAWLSKKREHVVALKCDMDAIDGRIYDVLMKRYQSVMGLT